MISNKNNSLFSILQHIITILLIVTCGIDSNAQSFLLKNEYDTNYIYSATEDLTTRIFSSVSYTDVLFRDKDLNATLSYSIHSKLHFGIGFNYSLLGVNLSLSTNSNSDANAKYGETKSIDLRMNLYGRSIIFDLYLIKHSGFYLSNPEAVFEIWSDEATYPLRPDISVFSTGLVSQYIFNNKKFSLRATYVQNEWQKKSAGSIIVGGELFYSIFDADSSFIPKGIKYKDFYEGIDFSHSSSLNIGLNGGYSHTFVMWQHFFFSVGLTAGPQFTYTILKCKDKSNTSNARGLFGINSLIRAGTGYNSKKIYVGVFFISENLANSTIINNTTSLLSVGIFKLNMVYRFTLNKPIKFLNPNYWKFLQPNND